VAEARTPSEQIAHDVARPTARATGIARGLSIQPGSDDDGWCIPSPVSLSDGSNIRLLKDGEALRCWYEALSSARRSILLETYIFAADHTATAFQKQLIRKAKEGVRVYVIYDSFGSHQTPLSFFREMKAAGVKVQEFHPIAPWRCNFSWRPFFRNHRKLLVVDGRYVGMGGLNIADEYGGSWVMGAQTEPQNLWRDCGISLEGPAAHTFAAAFSRHWLYITKGGRFVRALLSENLDGKAGPVGVLASVPTMGSPVSRLLRQLLRDARRSIELTSAYFAPGDDLVELMCRAARRGLRVRLMMPSETDIPIMVTAARSFYDKMLAAGIVIYERQQVKMHSKTLVIDGEISLLGSTNFDYRSIDYNCELSAIIRSREFGRQMQDLFEHDINFSACIHPGLWRHRPIYDRFVQWLVNRSRTLL
jgi:cardiolipin synthase A/B